MRLPAPLLLLRIDEGAAACDRIGMALLLAGVLIALHPLFAQVAAAGSGLFIVMACSAHASLIATLAAGAAVVAMAGSAKRSLARRMERV